MKKLFLLLALAPSAFLSAQKKSDPSAYAKTITPDDIRAHLTVVASKEMEGRETATPGQKRAAAYIESQFKEIGLLPGNNGEYQLKYPLYQDSLTNASIEVNGKSFALDQDFSINVAQSNTSFQRFSEAVFVGNGL